MAEIKLGYTFVIRKKSGTELWYFRHSAIAGPPPRLPGKPSDPAFHREYGRLLALATKEAAAAEQRADAHSVRTLVDAYRASDEWGELSDASRRDYGRELDRLCRLGGDLPYAAMTRSGVLALRTAAKAEVVTSRNAAAKKRQERDDAVLAKGKLVSTRRSAPKVTSGARTADYFKSVVSALYSWAILYQLLPNGVDNPTERVTKLQSGKKGKKNIQAYVPWTEHQIAHVLATARQPVAHGIIIGLYTGQRIEDCVSAKVRQCVGPVFRVTQSKTGTPLEVPITGPLVELVARRRDGVGDRLLVQANGKPYSKRLFSEHLRAHLDSLGYHDLSFHGLRYAAASRLQEAGCTVATISDIIGHSTFQMAMKYLAARERMGRVAEVMEAAARADNA